MWCAGDIFRRPTDLLPSKYRVPGAAEYLGVLSAYAKVFTGSAHPIPHTRTARDGRRNKRHPTAPISRLPPPPQAHLSRTMFILCCSKTSKNDVLTKNSNSKDQLAYPFLKFPLKKKQQCPNAQCWFFLRKFVFWLVNMPLLAAVLLKLEPSAP